MPIVVSGQINDTISNSVTYQKTLIKKGKFQLYGYTSFDLVSADESGLGITLTIPNKRKKKHYIYKYEKQRRSRKMDAR